MRKDVSALKCDAIVPKEMEVEFAVSTFLTVLTWCLERSPKLCPSEIDAIFRRLAIAGLGLPHKLSSELADNAQGRVA